MAFAMISGFAENADKLNSASEIEAAGAAVGTGLGAFLLLILWVMGDIILGLLYLVARPSKRWLRHNPVLNKVMPSKYSLENLTLSS